MGVASRSRVPDVPHPLTALPIADSRCAHGGFVPLASVACERHVAQRHVVLEEL